MEMDENGQEEDSGSMCVHVYNLQTRLLNKSISQLKFLIWNTAHRKLLVIISILPRMAHNNLPDA